MVTERTHRTASLRRTTRRAPAIAAAAVCAVAALAIFGAGCGDDDQLGGACPRRTLTLPSTSGFKLDVLIVADTSPAMQAAYGAWALQPTAQGVTRLIDGLRHPSFGRAAQSGNRPCSALDRRGCALPDLRVGLVSADLGAGGKSVLGCSKDGGGAKLVVPDPACAKLANPWLAVSGTQTNVDTGGGSGGAGATAASKARDALICLFSPTALRSDCQVAQPLEAARRALTVNKGFLRDDAALLLLFVSAYEDCSAADGGAIFDAKTSGVGPLSVHRCVAAGTRCAGAAGKDLLAPGARTGCVADDKPTLLRAVDEYVRFFRERKPARLLAVGLMAGVASERLVVAGSASAPTLEPSCSGGNVRAQPAPRLVAFADAFGGAKLAVCDDSRGALVARLVPTLLSRCLDAPAVTDSALACREDDVYFLGAGVAAGGKPGADAGTCDDRTLHEARCEVRERVIGSSSSGGGSGGNDVDSTPIGRCPVSLWYPKDPSLAAQRDCKSADACPCWRLVRDPVRCGADPSRPPYRLDVLRADATAPDVAAGRSLELTCTHAAHPWGAAALGDADTICRVAP